MSKVGETSSLQIEEQPALEPEYKVSVAEFEAKYKSKQEVWQYVAHEMDGYCPAFDDGTIYFLQDLVFGVKHRKCDIILFDHVYFKIVFGNEEITPVRIPQWEDLSTKKLWAWLDSQEGSAKYFPVEHERKLLTKQWICDVARAAYGQRFLDWLNHGMVNKYEKVTDKKVGYIGMTKRAYDAFKASKAVSGKYLQSHRTRSHCSHYHYSPER